jgi:cell wall-associated NlpC family hydrolase
MVPAFEDNSMWKRLLEVTDSWMGTPYKHLQMVKGRGADCALFVAAVWKELGILTDVVYDYYPRDWHIHTKEELVLEGLYRHFAENCHNGFAVNKLLPTDEKIRGDLLGFSTTSRGVSNHGAIYIGEKIMVHSAPNRGVSKFPYGGYWERRITTILRIMKW